MASPHVAGVAAMYFSYNPNFTVLQVAQHMFRNADDLGNPGRDEFYGHGRVDMYPFN
jgi:subtilisin family serine protease